MDERLESSVILGFRRAPEVRLAVWGFGLNALWEALQSPLYADFNNRGWGYLVWSRLHCTAGDMLILLAAFWADSLLFRTRFWPGRGGFPAAVFVGLGLAFTVWSEIHNAQIVRTWAYAASMPLIYGIGLAPLLQWLVIPPALVVLLRRG